MSEGVWRNVVYKASEMDKVCSVSLFDGQLYVFGVDDQPAISYILPSLAERRREQAEPT